jgi:CheY-like chemotaxis protein
LKLRALVLDDDPSRYPSLSASLKGRAIDFAKTARTAIAKLEKNSPYDVVLLDHDLDEAGPRAGTGMDVALHLIDLPKNKLPKAVRVHSRNSSKAREMATLIRGAGVRTIVRPIRD